MSDDKIILKVLHWVFIDQPCSLSLRSFVRKCDGCQMMSTIGSRQEMPQKCIHEVELFDVRGMEFMSSFLSSYGNVYILVVVDYISKMG